MFIVTVSYRCILRFTCLFLFITTGISAPAAAGEKDTQEVVKQHYRVKGNKVDPQTFRGYTSYHSVCVACHGLGGEGTESAPDLTNKVKNYSPDEFELKVLHKYSGDFPVDFTVDDWQKMEETMLLEIIQQENPYGGDLSEMPRWQNNRIVSENVYNIYRYLRARADGVIDTSRPGVWK